jgi:hypothetical protein
MFKLIVAGSRTFNNYNFLKEKLNHLLQNVNEEIEIVSGTAKGADTLGEKYALEFGFKIKYFKPNWTDFGKVAGFLRNTEMAKYSDACVVFWKNKSNGSKHMIDQAKNFNLKLRVYEVT